MFYEVDNNVYVGQKVKGRKRPQPRGGKGFKTVIKQGEELEGYAIG